LASRPQLPALLLNKPERLPKLLVNKLPMPRLLLTLPLRNAKEEWRRLRPTSKKSRPSLELLRELSGSSTVNSTKLKPTCPREREDTERPSKRDLVFSFVYTFLLHIKKKNT